MQSFLVFLLLGCGADEPVSDTEPLPAEELVCDDAVDDDGDGDLDCDDADCDLATTDGGGACVNEEDLALYVDFDANREWNKCVPTCLTDVKCNTDCLRDNTGMTRPCSKCFAEMVECFIGNCAAACVVQPPLPECAECVDAACGDDYAECFGDLVCKYETGCRDTFDNDGDGHIDAEDSDCD